MKIYVLVVAAGVDVSSVTIAPLIGKLYRNIPAMREAVEQTLGAFEGINWEFYPADYFCEKWNTSLLGLGVPSPDETYIAFMEVDHDE